MDFEKTFPLRFWINLGRREDRRSWMASMLAEVGVTADRRPAVDAMRRKKGPTMSPDSNKLNRGYENSGRYALALTQRLLIREARKAKAPAVLLIEDDAVFHPNFRQLIQTVELPDDWGIFYLGCTHNQRPSWSGARTVKVNYAVDTHAIAIRAPYYGRVMEMLDRHGKVDLGVPKASDQFIALLHKTIPTYACFPNLAWQMVSGSDLLGEEYTNYHAEGLQKNWVESTDHLLEELTGPASEQVKIFLPSEGFEVQRRQQPRMALLFLTRDDVNHPEIWTEFVSEVPNAVRIFSHRKRKHSGGFLAGTEIGARFATNWGDISLVRASRALLLEALDDPTITHFALLSESCIPVKPLSDVLKRLSLDPRSQFGYADLSHAIPRHADRARGAPKIPKGCWRFQSQWWILNREAAVFSATEDFTGMFEKMTIPDEAYFATVLCMQGYPLDGQVVKKDSTWAWWDKDAGSPTEWMKLPGQQLREILHSDAIFARKFPKGADIGRHKLHKSPAINFL